jgi:quinol monooxygenase YgiN
MSKIIFTIQYELKSEKKEDYLVVIKELKNLLKAEGLESYSVYELKGKPNHFQEIYSFTTQEAFDAFDDNQNERVNILIAKLNEMTVDNTTKYSTLYEVSGN